MYSGLREVQAFGVGQKPTGTFAHQHSLAAKLAACSSPYLAWSKTSTNISPSSSPFKAGASASPTARNLALTFTPTMSPLIVGWSSFKSFNFESTKRYMTAGDNSPPPRWPSSKLSRGLHLRRLSSSLTSRPSTARLRILPR